MTPDRRIHLKIASPCQVPWSSMQGGGAIRHCTTCQRDVYDLSEMTTAEVEVLLGGPGDRPCVRFFQRHDGTVMTADCPAGARRVRRRRVAVAAGAGLLSALAFPFMAPHQGKPARPLPVVELPIAALPPVPVAGGISPPPVEVAGEAPLPVPAPDRAEMMGKPKPGAPRMGEPQERMGDAEAVATARALLGR